MFSTKKIIFEKKKEGELGGKKLFFVGRAEKKYLKNDHRTDS